MIDNFSILTYKTKIPSKWKDFLDDLSRRCIAETKKMLKNRDKKSTKYYKSIPSVIAKGLSGKYQKNKKIKKITHIVIPIYGDKGEVVKVEGDGIRIPRLFKKEVIPAEFPRPIIGHILYVEIFKRDKEWYLSYCYKTPCENNAETSNVIGVDRNAVGNVAVMANPKTGKVRKLGSDVSKITENYRNRRKNLQKANAKKMLKKLSKKQSNRVRDINHKVSRSIVDWARENKAAIVIENLGKIKDSKKCGRYVKKSQWAYYQLELFIGYKAALLGIPIWKVNPAFTSKACSRCGTINVPNGKRFVCTSCGHFDHRDANAAFNIAQKHLGDQAPAHSAAGVRSIGGSPNLDACRAEA